jgi:hypothetical protein
MIRTQRIINKLKPHCPAECVDLQAMFRYLYIDEGLSVWQIADLLAGEASRSWVRYTLLKMGFTLRDRGGPHPKHPTPPNLVEEAKILMPKEIALKYNLPMWVIYHRLKKLTQEPSHEDDDTSQE